MSAGPGSGTDPRDRSEFPGVMMALVTDNQDPQGLGRVKLTYPWADAPEESYWARIAAPMAGPDRGEFFLPEEGDEVLVAFEGGDLEHPYVLGGLWNGQREPPEDNADGNNDIRTIRSRSGHSVTFDDADSGGGVTIETAGGSVVDLADESGSGSISITDESGENSLTFDLNSGSVTLSGSGTVAIEAANIELSGSGGVSIETSGMLTLKGSLVKIN
jgi:uncharacterized protein involved in type VI secretion and phage assembly